MSRVSSSSVARDQLAPARRGERGTRRRTRSCSSRTWPAAVDATTLRSRVSLSACSTTSPAPGRSTTSALLRQLCASAPRPAASAARSRRARCARTAARRRRAAGSRSRRAQQRQQRAGRSASTGIGLPRQTTTLTSRPGTIDHLLGGLALAELGELGSWPARRPRSRPCRPRPARGSRRALAVDLQHQLDLVLHQRRFVDLRPSARRAARRRAARSRARCHSTCVMCGQAGYSTRSSTDRPSRSTARVGRRCRLELERLPAR